LFAEQAKFEGGYGIMEIMETKNARSQFLYGVAVATEDLPARTPVLLRGEIGESIRTAKQIGYDAIELHLRNAALVDGAGLSACCAKNDMRVSALATGLETSMNRLTLIDDDAELRAKALQNLKDHVDLAEKLDCLVIIGMMRGNLGDHADPDEALRLFREQLEILLKYAEDRGVTLALEAITSYINDYLNTMDETCDFIRGFGARNPVLHIDTHSMNIEDYDPVGSILRAGRNIGYVHFSEINRMYPGAGRMDFPAFMGALKKIGYNGYITVECLPLPNPLTAARRSLDYLKSIKNY
jgi:sugar phosphate isomerase/epimerase